MQEIEQTLSFIKGFFTVHHSSSRIRVVTAVDETVDNEEPAHSIRSIGKVRLLGYQYRRGKEEALREVMIAIGKNRHGTLHVRLGTDIIRDLYPSPGDLGKTEILTQLCEQILGEEAP